MFAVPAKPGQWRTLHLQNGMTVNAELRGDEYMHYYQDANGVIYVQGEDNKYVETEISSLLAVDKERRELANALRRERRRAAIGENHDPYVGKKRGVVILVQFSDTKFQSAHDNTLFTRMMNEEGFSYKGNFNGSVRDYFLAQSNGLFELDFDVYGPYTLSGGMAYYGTDITDSQGNRLDDAHAGSMVASGCQMALADGVDFSPYDWDGDGYVDQVYVLYAGLGQANGGGADTVWPHEFQLAHSDFGHVLTAGSVRINTYACGSELAPLRGSNQLAGIGTLCHEFSHCLGLPDMYDTQYGGQYGMSTWDLMDSGSYNNNSFTPAGYTSYERIYAGWMTPVELNKDLDVSGMKGLQEGGEAYIVYNDGNNNEYFLLENRTKTNWDRYVPGEGLLITHVDFDADVWRSNIVNSISSANDHQRCTPVQADNGASGTSSATDVFPYNNYNYFSDYSTPVAQWYNYNSKGNRKFLKTISKITRASDKTISFSFRNSTSNNEDDASGIDYEGAIFAETFNKMNGTGGNDGLWSGSIGVGMFRGTDVSGWKATAGSAAKACAKFGNSSVTGSATTPAFNISGTTTLFFTAAGWDTETTELSVTVSNESASSVNPVLAQQTFTLGNEQWTRYATTLKGDGSVKVTFTPTTGKIFFLDGVAVREGDETAITTLLNQKQVGCSTIYDISGRPVSADIHSLPKGIYIVGGRKVRL